MQKNGKWFRCTACRKEFYRTPSEEIKSRGNGFYCSKECWYTRNKDLQCDVERCQTPPRGKGLCQKHYARFLRYGDPLVTKHEPNGSPNIKSYRKVRPSENGKRGSRNIPEHKWIAEQILGRRLGNGENLHHKDGDKLNNEPENLILFATMSEHRQYENRYREYLETCIRDGSLAWIREAPPFVHSGIELAVLADPGT